MRRRKGRRFRRGRTKKLSVFRLAKRLKAVSRSLRPDYLVSDDGFNDPYTGTLGGNTMVVSSAPIYKYFGYDQTTQTASTAWSMDAGIYNNDIRGNSFKAVSLTMRLQLLINTGISADSFNSIRCILFWDSGFGQINSGGSTDNNLPATNTQLLAQYTGGGNPISGSLLSNYNAGMVGRSKRYSKIFWDRTFKLNLAGNNPDIVIHRKFKLHRTIGVLNSVSGASVPSGLPCLFLCSDSNLAPHPQANVTFRMCYY